MSTATPREVCQAARMHQVITDAINTLVDNGDGSCWQDMLITNLLAVKRDADPLPVPEGAMEYRPEPKEFIKE